LSAASVDAVVVGAGIAGLAAATTLQGAGCEVVVVDPSDRPGGVMRTDHVNGYVVERGPNTTLVKAPMQAYLASRGLEGAMEAAAPESRLRSLVRGGVLAPLPDSLMSFAKTPLLSRAAKLRLLAEPLVRRKPNEAESVSEFMSRRLGSEVAESLVGPFLTGVYAGDETQLGADAVFPRLTEHERRFGSIALGALFGGKAHKEGKARRGSWAGAGGFGPLARKIADQLGEPPALGSRVVGLGRDISGWRVDIEGPSGDMTLATRRVVLATPSLDAANLLRSVSGEITAALEALHYAPVATVPLGVDRDKVRERIEGFGFLVPRDEGRNLLGCLYMSRLFPSRAPEGKELLHCMIGGARWPEVIHASQDEILTRVYEDLNDILGLEVEPLSLGVTVWPRAIPQPDRDHGARMRWAQGLLAEVPGLALAGSYAQGVSVGDTLVSGVEAARRLL
jgi:oxygen-dependent protoporphyrinogen oxidase